MSFAAPYGRFPGPPVATAPSHKTPYINPNQQITGGISLGDAVASQPYGTIVSMLAANADEINTKGWNGLVPLHKACLRGQLDVCELLVRSGANVNVCNDAEETPLHYAAKRGNPATVDLLLRAGADPDARDNLGKHALHHAASTGSLYCILYLETALKLSHMNLQDSSGKTPLHYAISHDQKDVIRCLLKNNRVSPDLADLKGCSPLHHAAETGNPHFCYLIISSTPSGFKLLQATNSAGQTPSQSVESKVEEISKTGGNTDKISTAKQFLFMISFAHNLYQLKTFFISMWLQLLLGPFILFAGGVVAGHFFPLYNPYFITFGTFCAVMFVKAQSHRIGNATQMANPSYAGAFIAGYVHTNLCFYFAMTHVIMDPWVWYAVCGLNPVFIYFYGRLLFGNPGHYDAFELQSNGEMTTLVYVVRSRRSLYESYCPYCEKVLCHERVKHCRLCDVCVEDMDHHCLFLLRCVAKNNLRTFALFMLITWLCVTIFLWNAYVFFEKMTSVQAAYGFWFQLKSFYFMEPWVIHMTFLNLGSWIFGLYMNYTNLSNIAKGQTYFYRVKQRFSLTSCVRNLFFFFTTGRIFSEHAQTSPLNSHHMEV